MPARSHGKSRNNEWRREYRAWVHMRERCRNPNTKGYERYGGRGISVCARWDDFSSFLADMGASPGDGYSIDRRDNDGNYEKDNCRWATQSEQNFNKTNPGPPPIKADAVRVAVARLTAEGLSTRQIATVVGVGKSLVHKIVSGAI